jgi:hypothetical protein
MTSFSRRLRAVFVVAVACSTQAIGGAAWAQNNAVDVPAYRQLGATETMAPPGADGTDYSANPPSLSGLALLATIPAAATPRRGYLVQAQCAAGLTIALDDPQGALTPTIVVLAGAAADGGQGGSFSMQGTPHTGRIRIYSSNASCQMAARSW